MSTIDATSKRHLSWEGCYNIRDLGGLPLPNGGRTASRSIIRADNLGRLTASGRQALLDYGVRTVIDLRSSQEVCHDPPARFGAKQDAPTYLNIPLEGNDPAFTIRIKQAPTRADVYSLVLDHDARRIAEALGAIVRAQPGSIVIHCHSGKDRTGIISALLCTLAGVPPALVAADYALSKERLWLLYESSRSSDDQGRWATPNIGPETMIAMLNRLDSHYGGVEQYLAFAGLESHEIGLLKQRLL